MIDAPPTDITVLARRLAESEATIKALLSGEIDAVVDPRSNSPVLLAIAQQALKESEERYRGIVETANEGIWTMNFDGTISFVNQRLADMLGYAVTEIAGQSLFEFLPASAHESARLRLARAGHGVAEENETAILSRSGQERHVLVRTSCIRDVGGVPVGLLAMITDRTAQREAQDALRLRESEYRQIVESSTDGIIKVDREGTIGFVNGRLAEMLGYSPADLVGNSLSMLVPAAEWGGVIESIRKREQGSSNTFDTVYRHRSGAEISVNIAGSAVRDAHGNWIGVLGFVRDVTERKKLQAQLIVSDRMASVGALAAGVAHEINNPLAAIVANLEFISEGVSELQSTKAPDHNSEWIGERIVEPLADAREAAERVRFIVRDLMIFSRSPSDEAQPTVDVNAALESALRMGWNEIRHRAELVKDLADVPLVSGNEARLGQVFLNLIVNAAQAIPDGHSGQHKIRVSTSTQGEMVVVEISDTGTGIAPEAIDRIFDAFYTTKDVGAGTGLGLAICQRIVADMHGTLTVSSEVGFGSTFRVSVPIATEVFIGAPVAAGARVPRPGARILVIDDEEIVARIVQRALDASYEVMSASSAWAALALIETGHTFDVILCDLMMPNMTGMELHQTLLTQFPDQAGRMLFMTGGAFTPEGQEFMSSRNCAHIQKPFDLEGLRNCVHDYLASVDASL